MQKVDRQSTVTFDSSRYSVPTKYACLPAVVRAYHDRIEVLCKDQIIASHNRIEAGGWALELEHYLPILERKPGLLDSEIPFKRQAWSDAEQLLRRELEYRFGEEGTRQFLSIVLLGKEHPWRLVREAIDRCVGLRAFHEQAVRLELQRLIEGPVVPSSNRTMDMSRHPTLPVTNNGMRDLSVYDALLNDSQTPKVTMTEVHDSVELFPIVASADHVDSVTTITSVSPARSAQDDEEDLNPAAIKHGPQLTGQSPAGVASTNDAGTILKDRTALHIGEREL